jgi:hypothetical protein
MPQPRHRHKGHPHQRISTRLPQQKPPKKRNAKVILAIFIGLLGVAVSFFAGAITSVGYIIGGLIGALVGFLIGRSMDAASDKKTS